MTKPEGANIYTVEAGRPFLDCLAAAILDGTLPRAGGSAPSVLDLPSITLYLPTRRATRALQDAFRRAAGGRALLLPKVVPVSEGEEDLSLITAAASSQAGEMSAAIPPAISELERRLVLTSLIRRWTETLAAQDGEGGLAVDVIASTSAQAAVLAHELAQLMDMVETEGVNLDRLAELVPETFSEHWQRTLRFLEVITQAWPGYLAGTGLMSAAARRNAVIRAEAERLRTAPPTAPVIVAGVTGSIPATVELMRAVADLPNGAIVLPALDTALDDPSFARIAPEHPEHPQFGLKKLLDALGHDRRDVAHLGDVSSGGSRTRLISEAMRPAGTTALWEAFAAEARRDPATALPHGLSLVEAPTAQDEAEAVALILREAAETPGRTAALVSPDRLLARRVAVRLEAWGITVDDSAGRPLRKTPPGALLDLVIDAVETRFAPAAVVSLLKHPLARLGLDPFAVRRAARALELAAFRTPYLGDGIAGLEAAFERASDNRAQGVRQHPAVDRLWDEDWQGAHDLIRRLSLAFTPLTEIYARDGDATLRDLADAHCKVAEAVTTLPVEDGMDTASECPLWRDEAGATAARFFASLLDDGLPPLDLPAADYADLYRSLAAAETVRPRGPVHPRLFIWGPFEARLQQTDVVVLGSLNEGTWPQAADPGPWLNRPMREALGLPSPEEKNGQAAHDFATLLAAPEVVLTRAAKKDGVPTVPSRWLLRLKALLDGMGAQHALTPKLPWLHWARERDRAKPEPRLAVPEPRPAVASRPRKLSVSRIETWIANPYAIFAREILGLQPLSPLGEQPGPALRGSIIHHALSEFAKAYPAALPENAEAELVRFARATLDAYAAHPRIAAFWVPRFARFAAWFAKTEAARREGVQQVTAEVAGELIFDAPGGPFKLTARADRIDIAAHGLVISDYKTGAPPTDRKVLAGASPQLPLEAAIALDTGPGFEKIAHLPVTALRYIRASGGEPPGEERDIKADDVAALAAQALDGLKRHVARFDDPATPYRPLRRSGFNYDYDDYAHLARVAEWSSGATMQEEA
ncbi:double-strand break repair protein AddB [Hyphomicrobium nitrativorans NL23]|uniref:Double-strand break repair protein AddB n=1 Tax=Hyphomicrobium nitrativorans NL23 TaxID=1029756 RepID=V5SGR9_9HYPH|nr:double-strand break repair protein AddB [Hyphomicrobium nitrativorans]AHB49728.1 double-strand break repair protein AddB [Hyphomicrobium nitrativorans NL23]